MSINKKISDYLREKGISQGSVAKTLGISASSLNKTLNNDNLKVSTLIEISKAVGVSPAYFFSVDNDFITQDTKDLISELKRDATGLQSQLEFTNKLLQIETTGRLHKDNYFIETIGYILANSDLLKNVTKENLESILLSLRENVHCRFEYGYSYMKFVTNIYTIFRDADELPFVGEKYDNVFKVVI